MATNKKLGPAYVGKFLGIDSHLSERNGSTPQVTDLAAERPAGRKLAADIVGYCNQLAGEGYEVGAILPLVSGRAAEATLTAEETNQSVWVTSASGKPPQSSSLGYSVTDGVVVIGRRR